LQEVQRMIKVISVIVAGILLSLLFFEMMAGCGEVTYSPDRTWKGNECLFLPSRMSYGKW
jgi:hypothetical protein